VRGQEGGSPRILVIDDGSTELETRKILADLAHDWSFYAERMQGYRQPATQGIAPAARHC
jgi:hypothetical protein